MLIRNRLTGELTTISQFKSSQPNTSFPKQITTEILDSFGYDPVLEGAQSSVTAPYEVSVRDGVEEIEGQWFTRYITGPIFFDTVDEDGEVVTADENAAAYKSLIDSNASAAVRTTRTTKLAESDWTQLADSTADKDVWAEYRTALRDLPSAVGFPHDFTWPEEPS
jgi:hypothetical protein